jgi:hypothetical protein
MDETITALGIGVWFGLTGPTAIHVVGVILHRLAQLRSASSFAGKLSLFIQFVVIPVGLFGLFGCASVVGGLSSSGKNLAGFGMVFGLALYALTVWLIHKHKGANASAGT